MNQYKIRPRKISLKEYEEEEIIIEKSLEDVLSLKATQSYYKKLNGFSKKTENQKLIEEINSESAVTMSSRYSSYFSNTTYSEGLNLKNEIYGMISDDWSSGIACEFLEIWVREYKKEETSREFDSHLKKLNSSSCLSKSLPKIIKDNWFMIIGGLLYFGWATVWIIFEILENHKFWWLGFIGLVMSMVWVFLVYFLLSKKLYPTEFKEYYRRTDIQEIESILVKFLKNQLEDLRKSFENKSYPEVIKFKEDFTISYINYFKKSSKLQSLLEKRKNKISEIMLKRKRAKYVENFKIWGTLVMILGLCFISGYFGYWSFFITLVLTFKIICLLLII